MSFLYSDSLLNYLDALLKFSNFTKAAKSLYVSQPHLTQTLKRTEQQLGCEIINRNTMPYRLTEEGKLLYQYLSSTENKYVNLLKEIESLSQNEGQTIKIGILPSLGTYLLPLFIPDFLTKHPDCRIELVEDYPHINERRIQNGEIDFFIGQNSSNIAPNLVPYCWGKHSYLAIIPKSSPIYQNEIALLPPHAVQIPDLLNQPLLLTVKGSAIRRQIDSLLHLYKIKPRILLESCDITTVLKLSLNGLGITFVPESITVSPNASLYNLYPMPLSTLNLDYFISHMGNKKLSRNDRALVSAFLEHAEVGCNTTSQESHPLFS